MPISPLDMLDRVLHGRNAPLLAAKPVLPLQGLTVLAVEDSRFAADALRLMCQRSGARLRRADTLQSAYGHLRVYRPDVVLVDLGLPDGRGEGLIRDLASQPPPGPTVIGISGDQGAQSVAILAGAHGFIEKPFASLAAFQAEILRHLPDRADRPAPQGDADPAGPADLLALRDDLEQALHLTRGPLNIGQRRYLAGFVGGIARSAQDEDLSSAAENLTDVRGLDTLQALLIARLHAADTAFGRPRVLTPALAPDNQTVKP